MLTALTDLTCAQCRMPISPGDPVDYVLDELRCEDCVLAHQFAISGL
ncbi:hypothetical protein ACFYUY_04755 [Kitasatospora sp. NPDC004745]